MIIFLIAMIIAHAETPALDVGKSESAVQDYVATKSVLSANEQASRELMAKLYRINSRMKIMSRTRDKTNNKLIDVENRAAKLAKSQAELESLISEQRKALSKRLRLLYKLGESQLMRLIFSATSSQDLHQNMKFMRLVTEQDYRLIKSHQKNLVRLKQTKKNLQGEVQKLVAVRNLLQRQEGALEKEQEIKVSVLDDLSLQRKEKISDLKSIRKRMGDETGLLDFSFFENKGKLSLPVSNAYIARGFGVVEHPEYGYRLSHKGLLFQGAGTVRAVYQGTVAYVGKILGYGETLIIDHGDHYYSLYSNLNDLKLTKGQKVSSQEQLTKFNGKVYFEIRHFSDAIDPKQWLKEEVPSET